MKKRLLLLLNLSLPLLVSTAVSAKTVDAVTAQTAGANFAIGKNLQGVNSAADLQLTYTASLPVNGAPTNEFYVYNFKNGKGFVIISADDMVTPVLAFSDESNFDINNISPSTKSWIGMYTNRIASAIANNVPARSETPGMWNTLITGIAPAKTERTTTTAVRPLLTTTWDQDGGGSVGYNKYCPNTATTSGLSVTGCVATAMAQLMKFWNWPTTGTGSHTYYDPYSSSEGMGSNATLTADFGNTVYDWASMPLTSSNAYVATLMYHCGVSVNMSYSATESGSFVTLYETYPVNCAEYALKTYFHYSPNLNSMLREGLQSTTLGSYWDGNTFEYCKGAVTIDSVLESTWLDSLEAQLNAGHPMLYEGTGGDGGHCWVCDGYVDSLSGTFFHFNWGWSGASNGYYSVQDLAPPALGAGGGSGNFDYAQGIVKNVVPDSFPDATANIKLLAHLNCTTSSPMKFGTNFQMTTKILNGGTTSFSGELCARIYDVNNIIVATMAMQPNIALGVNDSSAVITFNDSDAATNMIPVTYHYMRLFYKSTGTTTWTAVGNNGSFFNYNVLDVMNDTDIVLWDSLHVGSHDIPSGHSLSITTKIANQIQTGVAFHGTLRAILVNTTTLDTFVVQNAPGISIGNYNDISATFSNSSITAPNGVYALIIQHQYSGTGAFYITGSDYYANPILVDVGPLVSSVPTVAGAKDVLVYPNPAKGFVNLVVTGTKAQSVNFIDIQGRIVKTVAVDGNEPIINIPVAGMATGDYFILVQTEDGFITKKVVIENN